MIRRYTTPGAASEKTLWKISYFNEASIAADKQLNENKLPKGSPKEDALHKAVPKSDTQISFPKAQNRAW